MPVLNRDDFFARIHERIGTDNSEEATTFLEDMTDTFNDMEQRATNASGDWERKYHELDEALRTRYRHRFFHGDTSGYVEPSANEEEEEKSPEDVTIESLFEEEKK